MRVYTDAIGGELEGCYANSGVADEGVDAGCFLHEAFGDFIDSVEIGEIALDPRERVRVQTFRLELSSGCFPVFA